MNPPAFALAQTRPLPALNKTPSRAAQHRGALDARGILRDGFGQRVHMTARDQAFAQRVWFSDARAYWDHNKDTLLVSDMRSRWSTSAPSRVRKYLVRGMGGFFFSSWKIANCNKSRIKSLSPNWIFQPAKVTRKPRRIATPFRSTFD